MYKTLFYVTLVTAFAAILFTANVNDAVGNTKAKVEDVVPSAAPEFNEQLLIDVIERTTGLKVFGVLETPMPTIAVLITENGPLYSTYSGDYVISGKVFNIVNKNTLPELYTLVDQVKLAKIEGLVRTAQAEKMKQQLKGMETFADDMIVYKAKDEKYVITAFTDITCGYCRKLHAEIDDFNARGITVRYLAFPRGGVPSQSYDLLRSVWCSDDPAAALTQAKTLANSGRAIEPRTCDTSIAAQLDFGQAMGISGTPAIILPNGTVMPGYKPAAAIEQDLKNM